MEVATSERAWKSVLDVDVPTEGEEVSTNGTSYVMRDGILRQKSLLADLQKDLADFYDKHWKLPDAYDSKESDEFQTEIFRVMFPGFEEKLPKQVRSGTVVLDVGCGSGAAGRAYFAKLFERLAYVAADMSSAIEQAKIDFAKHGIDVALVQGEINHLPFKKKAFDIIFCPGVLHYTLDMKNAIASLAGFLKPGGQFVTWIYMRQKPIRHLTDEFIRSVVSNMKPDEAFEAVRPLTRLGIALGELRQEINVPEDIPMLGIKAGKYDLQRFFYYHIMKLFYNPSLSLTRHIVNNWNAYYPKHVLFLPPEQIKNFFAEAELSIEESHEHGNGISIIARKH